MKGVAEAPVVTRRRGRSSMALALAVVVSSLMMPASTYPTAAGGGKPGGGGGGGGPTSGADVSITLTDSPDPVEVGGDLTYKATAKNSGPQTATGVTVTDQLPAAVEFVSASSTNGSCTGSATVTCNLGDLVKRATATVTILVRPTQSGTITNQVTVGATQTDSKNADNSAATSTTVTGSPSPSPTPTTSPSPTSSPTPTTSPSPTSSPTPTTSPSPTGSPTPTTSPTPPSGSGVLDDSFGTGGKITTDFGRGREKAQAVALQDDGKIVVAGCAHAPDFGDCRSLYGGDAFHFTLARYTSAGALDPSFGDNGQVVTAFGDEIGEWAHGVADLAIRSDGKIVAAGTATKCPVRIDAPSACPFGGWRGLALARYESDGTLDPIFGRRGTVIVNPQPHGWGAFYANAMALQPDGKIIVVGTTCCPIDFLVARFLENGLPDPTFGGDGVVTTAWVPEWDVADAVIVQEDGKIVAGGWSDGRTCACNLSPPINFDFALARYNSDGTLDASFGDGGKVLTDFGGHERLSNMTIRGSGADARLVAVGNGILARYNLVDGSLDQSFGSSGSGAVTTPSLGSFHAKIGIAFDAAGRIVLAGDSGTDFGLMRYSGNGALDTSFGTRGTVITDFGGNDGAADVVLQPDGRIIAVGPTSSGEAGDFALARYLP